jgi:hypothetical protein
MDTKSKNPLSLVDVGHSARFSRVVKRVFRIAWVLAANGGVASLTFFELRSTGFYGGKLDPQLFIELLFEVILPVLGIGLELANWKFARWLNVGCFAGAGCFWLIAAVWHWSRPFVGVLLMIALGLFIVAGLTEVVYKATRSAVPTPSSAWG